MAKKRDFSKERMDSGIKRQQALDITVEFLEWYKEYLEKEIPYARNTINEIDELLITFAGGEINEVCATE